MKRITICTMMCAMLSLSLSARTSDEMRRPDATKGNRVECQKGNKPEGKKHDVRRMALLKAAFLKQRLTLDSIQYDQVKTLFLKEAVQMQKVRTTDGTENAKPSKEVMMRHRTEMKQKMKEILTDEQFALYEQLGKEHRQKKGHPHHRPRPQQERGA